MKSDTLKLIFTYITALFVIGGGFAMLYFTRLDPPEADAQGLRLLLSGFIGIALQFIFASDNSTRTARQIERIYTAANGTSVQPILSTDFSSEGPSVSLANEILKVSPSPSTKRKK